VRRNGGPYVSPSAGEVGRAAVLMARPPHVTALGSVAAVRLRCTWRPASPQAVVKGPEDTLCWPWHMG
jgi:hypothetical protein